MQMPLLLSSTCGQACAATFKASARQLTAASKCNTLAAADNTVQVHIKSEEVKEPVHELHAVAADILQGTVPAVPISKLLPLLSNGEWRNPRSIMPGAGSCHAFEPHVLLKSC
jgi:hypothetical protein